MYLEKREFVGISTLLQALCLGGGRGRGGMYLEKRVFVGISTLLQALCLGGGRGRGGR